MMYLNAHVIPWPVSIYSDLSPALVFVLFLVENNLKLVV
jgi:hypothetical protein